MPVNTDAVRALVEARHGQPFDVLGPHVEEKKGKRVVFVRSFQPEAERLTVVDEKGKKLAEGKKIDEAGLFEAELGERDPGLRYRLKLENAGGSWEIDDPYSFGPQLSEYDLHLLREGTHYKMWEKIGAHPMEVNGVKGVSFSVWAPTARRVSVVGDFNGWDGRRHPMRKHDSNGVWELFVPGLKEGQNYKYELLPSNGEIYLLKVDPLAFQVEMPPKTAGKVFELSGYEWKDQEWMERRKSWDYLHEPKCTS